MSSGFRLRPSIFQSLMNLHPHRKVERQRTMSQSSLQASRIVRAVSSRWQRWQKASYYKRLSVSEAFSDIYRTHAWGSFEDRPFCSGEGSIREEAVGPYCAMVRDFIAGNNIRRVVDLGCGDFAVGSRFIGPAVHYVGIDVVPDLIHYNQEHFGAPGVEFRCINIIDDQLPHGDLCLLRQVLQHLSNAQILKTLQVAAPLPLRHRDRACICRRGFASQPRQTAGPGDPHPAAIWRVPGVFAVQLSSQTHASKFP